MKPIFTTRLLLLALLIPGVFFLAAPGVAAETGAFRERVLSLPDGKQMNSTYRTGEGPVLVLVPGTWGTFARFETFIEYLPESQPVVVIELCWQGGQQPPTLDHSIESLADDVLWCMEALEITSFYISGHSIGGMIAIEIAGRDLPGMKGALPMEGWTHHTVLKNAFAGDVLGELTPEHEALRMADRARGRGHLSETQLKAIGTIWRQWNGYPCLERSKVPVLHIWGDRAKPRPDQKTLQIPDRPEMEIAWIADVGHLFLLQAPEPVANAVKSFIMRNP